LFYKKLTYFGASYLKRTTSYDAWSRSGVMWDCSGWRVNWL